jgi:hypothetical protein
VLGLVHVSPLAAPNDKVSHQVQAAFALDHGGDPAHAPAVVPPFALGFQGALATWTTYRMNLQDHDKGAALIRESPHTGGGHVHHLVATKEILEGVRGDPEFEGGHNRLWRWRR